MGVADTRRSQLNLGRLACSRTDGQKRGELEQHEALATQSSTKFYKSYLFAVKAFGKTSDFNFELFSGSMQRHWKLQNVIPIFLPIAGDTTREHLHPHKS